MEFDIAYGASYELAVPTHTNPDMVFKHWVDEATGNTIALNGTWNITSNVVLKAVWKEVTDNWTQFY